MDLLSLVNRQLTATTIAKISAFLGESNENTTTALKSAIPVVFGGVIQKASTNQGVIELQNLIKINQYDGGILEKFSNLFEDEETVSDFISTGASVLESIFGDKVASLGNSISGISGIKAGSASTLLSMITPIFMSVLGKEINSQRMGVSKLAKFLISQKNSVTAMLPTEISKVLNEDNLGDFLGQTQNTALDDITEEPKEGKSWLSWVLVGCLLLGALYYWQSCRNMVSEMISTPNADTTSINSIKADSVVLPSVGVVNKILSTGAKLSFDEKSIENELIEFIEDSSKAIDKTIWFNFRYLRFETGSAKIDSTSMQEVKNIAEIMKAYPINLRIGGYTDNVGQEELNMKLSADRAANVRKALLSMGIDGTRLTSEGYGSQHPVATNDTEEGRAQNRRIAVRVTKK
ncbi:OmpA family protein [Emticicia sp. SJ17W-69]|uniref:OmpA family protein n=1 Tax=Emticicia sp. SJ17W-69 TaxID=3421657 RepID=UPI003EC02562